MTVSSSLLVYQYIACAFTKLHFYIGACTFDDIGYDIVIVDENIKNKVFYYIRTFAYQWIQRLKF